MRYTPVLICSVVEMSLICLHIQTFLTSDCQFQGREENITDGGNNCMRTGKIASVVLSQT